MTVTADGLGSATADGVMVTQGKGVGAAVLDDFDESSREMPKPAANKANIAMAMSTHIIGDMPPPVPRRLLRG